MEKVWYCDDEIEFTVQSAKFPEGTDPKEMLITMLPYLKDDTTLVFNKCTSLACDSNQPGNSKVCYEFGFGFGLEFPHYGTLWTH